MDQETATLAVKVLLDQAQLAVSEQEFEKFVMTYPALRSQADALYREDLRVEAPALAYDPLAEPLFQEQP